MQRVYVCALMTRKSCAVGMRNAILRNHLKREIARMWNMRTVQVVPIVVGSLPKCNKKLGQVAGKVECQN